MKSFVIIITGICFFSSLNAQKINGVVIENSNSNPVEFATVILQTPDSAFVEAAYTDSAGMFSFQSDLNPFRLVVQHLNYETVKKEYSSQIVGCIVLKHKDNLLNEVVVSGERPVLKVEDGKFVYDMPMLIKNKTASTAYEALLELPGIEEIGGNVTLAGSNSLSVILNGKPSTISYNQLIELLKNMPSSMIEKAEIMYAALPQYHVKGAAINLIIKKNHFENLRGQVNANYSQKHYANYQTGINLFYNKNKFSADFLYSINAVKRQRGLDLETHHLYNNQVYEINQLNRGKSESQTHNVRLGMDYNLKENDAISLVYTSQITTQSNLLEYSTGNFSNSASTNINIKPTQMHNIMLDYTTESDLYVGLDYTVYKDYSKQDFSDIHENGTTIFMANSSQDVERIQAYIDKSYTLGKNWTLNFGTKFIYAKEKDSQIYHSSKDMSGLNTQYRQNEYTYDVYAGFSKKFSGQFSLSTSLTGEYYQLNDYREWTFFPTLSSTYVCRPEHIFQLSVSTNKKYPEYWEMNGSVSYLNGYTEVHGNTFLRPSNIYSMQFSYILKRKYIATLYNNYSKNYFVQLPYLSSQKLALIYQTINFDYLQRVGMNVSVPFQQGIFSSRLTVNEFFYKTKNSHFHDISFNKEKFVSFVQLNNIFSLSDKPNIIFELKGSYMSRSLQGPGELNAIYKMDMGIKWTFANKKAEINLKGENLFDSWTSNLIMQYSNQNLWMDVESDARLVSITFTYKFGSSKNEKEREDVDTSRFGK
jgi:hypothetical protein